MAPAGYGKTAALSRQLQRLAPGCAVAWLTADEDDDLQRLLSHLIEALEPLDLPWRLAREAVLDLVVQGRLREAATALLNALDATDTAEGVIVLDDLHAVADPRVFEFLTELLEDLPQNWTLVIASRVEPPLALGRWRARREVAEFDETALSFSRKEVEDLWRHVTGEDDPEQADRLLARTQGWAAGLSLSLEAPKQSAATALKGPRHSRRHLFDYLASEVFERLPGEMQEFLLRCSVLPELTERRCEQISGSPHAARLLEDIERRRLFSSVLDSEELTLRLHDLFRDFLEERLRKAHPEEVPALLRRAAQGEADPLRRTLMYLRAGAWEEAEQCLTDVTASMLASDEGAQVIRIVEQFPTAMQASSPSLACARGLCAWSQYQYAKVRSEMAHAAAGFDASGRCDDAQRARAMQGLSMLFCGDMEEARRLSQAVRSRPMDLETETLSELLDFWYEGHHGPADGPGKHLAKVVDLLVQGGGSAALWFRCMARINKFINRPGVIAQIQRVIGGARAAAGEGHWPLQTYANLTEAWLLLWQGRMSELEAAFQRIEEDSQWLGQPAGLRIRLLTLRLMHQVACDHREAVRTTCGDIIEQASLLERSGELPLQHLSNAIRALAAIGDWPNVQRHLPALQADGGRENPNMRMIIRTVEAQLALHEGRTGEALAMLRELAATSAVVDTNSLDATVRTQLALAELADGSPPAAWRALAPLIERVAAGGNVGQVLLTGLPSLTQLALASWGSAAPEEGLAALHEWVETAKRFKADSNERPSDPTADHAGLSGRELEVLTLLAGGQSNKLIARSLDLSPHTVKRHVARILDRLDLASRMQAAAWYHTHVGMQKTGKGTGLTPEGF
nr:LuxR C-terminal-related transcriptional regulator [Variovorax sp. JS1663]